MAEVTLTTAANFIPELWRDAILDYAEAKFRLKNLVTDMSGEFATAGGGDILHIPRVTEETAASLTSGDAVTYGANTDGKTDLTVNQHFYEAKRIGDVVRVQESADLFNMYTKAMGYALAKKVENYLAVDIIQSATANDVALATDNNLTAAKLRDGLQKLMDINVDYAQDAFLAASPACYSYMLGVAELVHANLRGDGIGGQSSGILKEVYGMPTFASVDWDDDGGTGDETASIFTSESVLFAMQIAPRVQASYDIDYLSTRVVADVFFGAVLTQAAATAAGQIVNFNNP